MTRVGGAETARWAWLQVGTAWAGALLFLAVLLFRNTTGSLQEYLKVWQYWSLDLCAIFVAVSAVVMVKALRRHIGRRDAATMASIAALAIALTLLVAPRTNRIFYDEQIYQAIGQNLADLRRAQVCNDGSVQSGRLACASGEYNKQPYAYPHVLSLV
jgi:hypothetical protein